MASALGVKSPSSDGETIVHVSKPATETHGSITESEIDEIIDEAPPRAMRLVGIVVGFMLVALVAIASLVEVDIVVGGQGELTMDAPPIVLQPMERAIVRSILVKAGDTVSKGQVLATLDPTFAQADVAALETQFNAVEAQVRRLEAEAKGEPFVSRSVTDASDVMQTDLFKQRQGQYQSRISGLDEQIAKTETIIKTSGNNQILLAQQLSIANEVEKMRTQLSQLELSSKLQLLESQNARLRAEREHRDAVNRQSEAEHDLASRKAERQEFIDQWRRQILEDLDRGRTELARLGEAVSKARRLRQLVEVTAPQDAVVLEIAGRSAGSVLREAEPLIVLVPANGAMIADISIRSSDVGYVKFGDKARVKVDAFPYQKHGLLEGTVRSVSESSSASQASTGAEGSGGKSLMGGAMHRVRIALTKPTLDKIPEGARLIPGMTVAVEIKIGTRSVLAYFFDPIRRGFDTSLREP